MLLRRTRQRRLRQRARERYSRGLGPEQRELARHSAARPAAAWQKPGMASGYTEIRMLGGGGGGSAFLVSLPPDPRGWGAVGWGALPLTM